MKKLIAAMAVVLLSTVCVFSTAYAVPEKSDSDSDVKITVTDKDTDNDKSEKEAVGSSKSGTKSTEKAKEKEKEKETEKATEKATSKATSKASEKSTSKATSKASEKATSKATAKATSKASEKATAKATSKTTDKPRKTETADEEENDEEILDEEDDVIVVESTPEALLNVQNTGEQFENKKYLTKGGAFLYFLFTVLVSAVISFAISYRFFKMAKKDNHLAAELRALKRDIDSKMVGTVGGFSEYDVNVTNNNENYSREGAEITSGRKIETAEQAAEMYKKWESQINRANENTGTPVRHSAPNPEYRQSRVPERRRPVSSKKKSGVSDKIKGVFNDIFPFEK